MAERVGQRVGQQLGNYRLIRLLGRGGFAEVYLGEHLRLGTHAAIKVLYTQLADDNVEGFLKEARTIACLDHPHIVRVLDFDVEDGTPFLVMNYASNGTLRQRNPKGIALPLATIVTYVKQIADALQYAHGEKLIHRDVKPENIFVGRRNEILLGDFGIAMVTQSSRYQNTFDMAGTMAYMAPEQIQGKPRPASDQYSLAVVVYEWLSGERPFHGSITEMVGQHLSVPPPPLREKDPAISPDVEQVVMTALAKDSKERFVSVQAFANALEQAGQSQQVITVVPAPQLPLKSPLPETEVKEKPMLPITVLQPTTTVLCTYRNHSGKVNSLAWTHNSTHIVSGSDDKTVQVWNATTGENVFTSADPYSVKSVAWSPDGTRIVSGGGDLTVHIWDTVTKGKVYTYHGHASPVIAVEWSPNGKYIASGGHDKTVQVWDAIKTTTIFQGHSGAVRCLSWSPDGKYIASGGKDQTVQVWTAATGEVIFTFRGHSDWVDAVACSPDGKHIASGAWDNTAKVWNTDLVDKLIIYRGHSSFVLAVAWSPDGKRIASASKDGTVQVWEAETGQHIFTYRGHISDVKTVAWSADGKYIASGGDDKTVQVWVAP